MAAKAGELDLPALPHRQLAIAPSYNHHRTVLLDSTDFTFVVIYA